MENKSNLYRKLFTTTFYLSAFTFGGGYVIVSLMKKKFVDQLGWMKEEEMLDYTAIAQSSPGPIAVNAAIITGYRIAGVGGALVSILGTILPPLIILSIISLFYSAFQSNAIVAAFLKGTQAGVAAVIADVSTNLGGKVLKSKNILSIMVMFAAFIATFVFRVNVVFIILCSALLGAAQIYLFHKKPEKEDPQ